MHSVKQSLHNNRYKPFVACCLAAVAAVLPGILILLRGRTLVWRDTAKLFQPLRHLIEESLTRFQLPLWNPHEALGIPLFAQMMHGVLHPVSVIFAFLAPGSGLDIQILVHTAMAAAGSTLLAMTLGLSVGASALTGISYGLSGYVLGMGSVIQYLYGASTAPWAIAGMLAAVKGTRYGITAAATGVAALFFAGDPQWAIVAIILGMAFSFEAGGKRGVLRAAIGVTIAAMVASVQLLPTMALLKQTSRGVDLDILDRFQWALSPWRLIEFVSPGFFGSPGSGLERWPVFVWLGGYARSGLEMPFVPSVYIGATTLLLAVRGIFHSRVTKIMAVAALILLWLAMGSNSGAEEVMHHIPVWGKFRYAEKMVGPFTLCVALLAGFGAELFSRKPRRFWLGSAILGAICSFSAALFISFGYIFNNSFVSSIAREAAPMARHNLSYGLVHGGAALAALAILVVLAGKWRSMEGLFVPATCMLVFVQLSVAAPYAMHAGLRGMQDLSYLKSLTSPDGPVRIATPLERNYLYPEGLNKFDAQIGIQSRIGVPCYNVAAGVDQFDTYTGLRPGRLELLLKSFGKRFGVSSAAALRRFGITDMMIKDPYFPDELEVAKAASQGGNEVLNDRKWGFIGWSVPHRPWAFFAPKVVVATGEHEALDTLVATISKGETTVVLEDSPLSGGLALGKILSFQRQGGDVRIEADAVGDGLLVVNDSFWPGWRATIDGKEVPIYRADFLVRAVPWPSGRHRLEMRYEPREVSIGWLMSGAGVLALLFMVAIERRRADPLASGIENG